jgi:hypothetical protein
MCTLKSAKIAFFPLIFQTFFYKVCLCIELPYNGNHYQKNFLENNILVLSLITK